MRRCWLLVLLVPVALDGTNGTATPVGDRPAQLVLAATATTIGGGQVGPRRAGTKRHRAGGNPSSGGGG